MAFRALLAFTAVGPLCRADCSQDPVPLFVIQFVDEVGLRPPQAIVRNIHLSNVRTAPRAEREQIANSLRGFCLTDRNQDEFADRIRDAFQRHGFFKARVVALQVKDVDNSGFPIVSVVVRVEEGPRYRLRAIEFTHNRAIPNTALLRSLFTLKNSDVFDTQMIRIGLDRLRQVYAELGYLTFTAVPDTKIDDQQRVITLTVDMDEGFPYFVNSCRSRLHPGTRVADLVERNVGAGDNLQ